MRKCSMCPRKCGENDKYKEINYCGEGDSMRVARAALHFWEEPWISGKSGSGAVFFTGCNLKCVFCQNYRIANNEIGAEVTPGRLAEIFFELKEKGALNINLVTPTHFIPGIAAAIGIAKKKGFDLPFVYNTSGYESVKSLKLLDGLIDVYLPDFKYSDCDKAARYSNAPDYVSAVKEALAEMYRQTGPADFDENGIIKKGVIVRHLLLPGGVKNAKGVIEYLYNEYKDNIYISIMNQYTPLDSLPEGFDEIRRKVTKREYNSVIDFAIDLGVTNAFIQEGGTVSESFIPDFNLEGVTTDGSSC